jgi:hypothetical protein
MWEKRSKTKSEDKQEELNISPQRNGTDCYREKWLNILKGA